MNEITRSKCSWAHILPVGPPPVWTSSIKNVASFFAQIFCRPWKIQVKKTLVDRLEISEKYKIQVKPLHNLSFFPQIFCLPWKIQVKLGQKSIVDRPEISKNKFKCSKMLANCKFVHIIAVLWTNLLQTMKIEKYNFIIS